MAARIGVTTMPSRLDAEAAHTAAATLPRATEVKAIDDCTVDGRQHRNIRPAVRELGRMAAGRARVATPNRGNRPNVAASTVRCRRQWVRPPITASRDSLAPWRKNNRAMASLVTRPKPLAMSPRTGRTVASSTIARMATI